MKKTNFDRYLEEQLKDPVFSERFRRAGEAWDVALQIAALRQRAGLSQKELAKLLKTSQQQISRLESPGYEGHSLTMLRRVAEALHAHVRVVFEPEGKGSEMHVSEKRATYGVRRAKTQNNRNRAFGQVRFSSFIFHHSSFFSILVYSPHDSETRN